jgi:hypothetical protein
MADRQKQSALPGGHYSGANPIPTVQEFMQKLDMGKKDRDKDIDEKAKKKVVDSQKSHAVNTGHMTGEQASSVSELKAGKGQRLVTDPVTGKDVIIENAKKDLTKEVTNPKVREVRFQRPKLMVSVDCSKCKSGKRHGESPDTKI